MLIDRIPITGREQWLALRRDYITASAIGALFGLHPYQTLAAVWAEKAGLYVPDDEETKLKERGRELEDVVGRMVAKRHPTWSITKADEFLGSTIKLGGTPDFYVTDDRGRRGVMQAKTVGALQYRRGWLDDVPPQWIILQCLTEAMLDGADFGLVGALEIGDFKFELHEHRVPRHPPAERRIVDATVAFWMSVDGGMMPAPDYRRDKALISALYPKEKAGKIVDWRQDSELPALLDRHHQLGAEIKQREADKDVIETRIKERMADAERALVDGFGLTFKQVTRKPYAVEKTKTYRQLRITKKAKKEAA
jgi:predicted phage-related endonuclease